MNYDASQMGKPYVRAHRLIINYPIKGELPSVRIDQSLALVDIDGNMHKLQELNSIDVTLDLATNGSEPIPLVDPSTGATIPNVFTNLNQVMLCLLAVVRKQQLLQE